MVTNSVGTATAFFPAPIDSGREMTEKTSIMMVNSIAKKELMLILPPAMKYVMSTIVLGNSVLGIRSASNFPKK